METEVLKEQHYVEELVEIIRSGLPKEQLIDRLSDYHDNDIADDLTKLTPDERRELFDEAAGIVKFKRRKSMSVKKLEDERQNLVRVNDILSELEKQVGPLERQSEKAREYLKRKEELKTYDINMFLLEMERIRDQIRNLDEKLRITKGELEEATRKYADTKTEYESIEEQVEVIDDSIEKANRQLNETISCR